MRGGPESIFVCDVFFGNSSSPMVLGPVSCPAEVLILPFLPCEMAKFFDVGVGVSHPIPSSSFVLGSKCQQRMFRITVKCE